MQNVEFNEEQPLNTARAQQAPTKSQKKGLTEWVMRKTGIQNRRTVEIILVVVAILCAGAAFIFATAEEPPPPYPYESPFGPNGINSGPAGIPTGQ